ncbi:hypothetical protein ACOMHN_055869 [Nucella lapillus]
MHIQSGFRSGRSTTEQLMSLRVVLDTCRTTKRRATIIFVDFRKAFDSLFRGSIPSTLADYGVPPEVIADVMQLYKDTTASVWTQHGETESFSTSSGALQGDTLSPFLFITVLDSVLRQILREEDGFTVKQRRSSRHPETKLCALTYDDDIAIISDTPDGAERTLHRLVSSTSRVGLEISKPKTEEIHIGDSDPPGPTTFPCGERVSECSEFKYLGVCTASPSHVIDTRFDQAWSAMSALKPIFTSKAADRIKIRLFRAAIESILCYGMESIPLTPTLSRSIDSRYRRMLRSALSIFYPDRISNDKLFAKMQLPPLSTTLRRRRLRLVGHILRMQTRSKSPLGKLLLNSESGHLRRGQGRTVTLLNDITTNLSTLTLVAVTEKYHTSSYFDQNLLGIQADQRVMTLVAVTEKYHTSSYFDQNLLGAQADQSVLRDLLGELLPAMARHLVAIDIEIATVTLNWFLAIFFDAVPFHYRRVLR